MLLQHAENHSVTLLRVTIYQSMLRLNPERSWKQNWDYAVATSKIISDEDEILKLVGDEEEKDSYFLHDPLEDKLVVDAIVRIFSVRRFLWKSFQSELLPLSTSGWVTLAKKSDVESLQQVLKGVAEVINSLDDALSVLAPSHVVESSGDLVRLYRNTSNRLKERRQVIVSIHERETQKVIYRVLFPRQLTLQDARNLFGLLGIAFVLGSYLFASIVFGRLQSDVVGLLPFDYLWFAGYNTILVVFTALLINAIVLLYVMNHVQRGHVPANFGKGVRFGKSVSFGKNVRDYIEQIVYIGVQAATYFAIGVLNTPAWLQILGRGIEVDSTYWWMVLTIDSMILLIMFLEKIPFIRIFENGFVVAVTSLCSVIMVGGMCFTGVHKADELRSPSASEWKYDFNDGVVTSAEHSYVYHGNAYVIFYKRNDEEFLLKKVDDFQSFSGTL